MDKYLTDFLAYLRVEKNYSINTIDGYGTDLRQFFTECGIQKTPELTKAKIREFLANMANANLAPTTRKRKLASIRSFMSFLKREGIIDVNVSLEVDSAKADKKLPKAITVNETATMLDSISNNQDRALVETLYGIGCRVSELVQLKISDIDFESRTALVFGKGNKERMLPINNSALAAIRKHLDTRNFESEYIFASRRFPEKPMTTRNARNIVYKYTDGDLSPHMLRHSYATHLFANGVDIRIIQELLGHSDINTTTIYTKVANDHMTNAYRVAHPRG